MVVADHRPSIRAQLRTLANGQPDLEVVGTGPSGIAALLLVHEFEPDVLVLDQDMEDFGGMDVAAHLAFAGIELRVVLYTTRGVAQDTTHDAANDIDCALEDESIDALLAAIRRPRTPEPVIRAD